MVIKTVTVIPQSPRLRRAWILFQLKEKGLSFTALAREEGVSPAAVCVAAQGRRSRPLMARMAQAVDVAPGVLFPEHFNPDGSLKRPARSAQRPLKEQAP
ncbi:helix-turn-helix domain-containing protein [Pararhodospirillum photometricum]|uniref:helix-turn-helix domain-containing protein n=1 Tax=Pararhodospirillum photometricum TaxID=1084 RepID=UPI0005A164FD|nr:helix-turn-helix domain-containing protein [Pararhodospirillum photometricum]